MCTEKNIKIKILQLMPHLSRPVSIGLASVPDVRIGVKMKHLFYFCYIFIYSQDIHNFWKIVAHFIGSRTIKLNDSIVLTSSFPYWFSTSTANPIWRNICWEVKPKFGLVASHNVVRQSCFQCLATTQLNLNRGIQNSHDLFLPSSCKRD